MPDSAAMRLHSPRCCSSSARTSTSSSVLMGHSVAKLCIERKQHIATPAAHHQTMAKSVNQIVSESVRFFMGERFSQKTLAQKANVAPNTVKNVLFPDKRQLGARGKEPSVKLTELDMIARALGVEVVDLLVDVSDEERIRLHRKRAGEYYAAHGELPEWAPAIFAEPGKRNGTSG